MKVTKTKKYTLVLFAVPIIIAILYCLFSIYIMYQMKPDVNLINNARAKVLYHTDHEELLRICRDKLIEYNASLSESDDSDGLLPKLSKVVPTVIDGELFELKPHSVEICKRYIMIVMCEGISYSVRLNAFPEGAKGFGDMEIIEGLWYCDDEFNKSSTFPKYLKSLKD